MNRKRNHVFIILLLIIIFILVGWNFSHDNVDIESIGAAQKSEVKVLTSLEQDQPSQEFKNGNESSGKEVITDKILDCGKEAFEEEQIKLLKEFSDSKKLLSELKNKSSFSSKLAYIINNISTNANKAKTTEEIREYLTPFQELINLPDNPKLAHLLRLSQCHLGGQGNQCSDKMISEAKENNSSNAALWFQIAIIESSKGNSEQLIEALRHVISAPNFDSYWSDNMYSYNKSLEEIGISNNSTRMLLTIGMDAASQIAPFGKLLKFCSSQSPVNAEVAEICLAVGNRLFSSSKTFMHKSIGISLQKATYSALEDKINLKKVSDSPWQSDTYTDEFFDALQLAVFDQELAGYWFSQLQTFGEVKTNELLIEEAIRLSSDPDYNPCPVSEESE